MEMRNSKITVIGICLILILTMLFPCISSYAEDTEEKTSAYVQYNFSHHLTDLKKHSTLTAWSSTGDNNRSNATTTFGNDEYGNYWQWHSNTARGGGFYIDIDKDIGEEYTIGLKFSFEQTAPSWKKIIDYKNSTEDTGFYFYNSGHLNFYNYGVNGASITSANQVVDMIVRRNKSKQFEAYIVDSSYNKKLDLQVTDTANQGVPAVIDGKTRLGFFFDDIATTSEASSGGKVYTLKIWDSYKDPDEVIDELRPRGYVNVHYVDEDGEKIIDDQIMEGIIGDPYVVKEKSMYGFEYLRSEGHPKEGKYPDGEEYDVTLVYKVTLPYSVTARYVDEKGTSLCEDIIYRGEDGEEYKTEQLEIKGYEFVKIEGNDTGFLKKHPQIVTYVYKEAEKEPDETRGIVNAQYVDEDGKPIKSDMMYRGYVNTNYQTGQLVIPGYKFKEVVGAENGVYAKDPTYVKYIYEKVEDIEDENIGGSVVVHYQDNEGNTIRPDEIFDGDIGESYQAIQYNIPKYKFDKVIGEESGLIEKDVKVITMIYIPMASNVIARYIDEGGNTIVADKIYSGGIGQSYQTEKKEIKGWKLEKIEGQESGVFSDEVQVVKYIYKRIGHLTVRCVDIHGNKILDDKIYTGYINEDYSMVHPEIDSYEFVKANGLETGQFKIEDQILEYVYEKFVKGTVLIQCVDEKGNRIVSDREIGGKVGTSYNISIPTFHGYEYIKTQGQSSGKYQTERAIVKFIYKLTMPWTVTARYVDKDGNELCQDIVYKGYDKQHYKTNQLEISGYELIQINGDQEGIFTEKPQLVTYIYKKKNDVDEKGQVIAKYVDEDGNELCHDLVYSGTIGTDYQTSQLVFSGYKFKEVIGQSQGTYQTKEQEVQYVYVKIDPDDMSEDDKKIGGSVLVKYEDIYGNTVKNDIVYNGDIGDQYNVVIADIDHYEFVKVVGEEKGEIEKDIKIITVIYEPAESYVQASTVIARYVDMNGQTIHFDNIYNGFVGNQYKTSAEEIENYKLVRIDGKESDLFGKDVKIVTYVYQKVGKIVVRYIDTDGNTLKEEKIYSGVIGDLYELNVENLEGYKLVRVDGKSKGQYLKGTQNITFVYEKIQDDFGLMGEDYDIAGTFDISQPSLYGLCSLVSILVVLCLKKRKHE